MRKLAENASVILTMEVFNILILLVVLVCLVYQIRHSNSKTWKLFFLYVTATCFSQLLDLPYKIWNMAPGLVAADRILSTLAGYVAFFATTRFIIEIIQYRQTVSKFYKRAIYSALVITLIFTLICKVAIIMDIGVWDGIVAISKKAYTVTFSAAMLTEIIMVVKHRANLSRFDFFVFLTIPCMHLGIYYSFSDSFNLQYILRNVGSVVLTLLVMGISMTRIASELQLQKEETVHVTDVMNKYIDPKITKIILHENVAA